MSPFVLLNGLSMAKGINQYRFIQEDVTRYTLWLNGNKDEIDEKAILDFISPYFGEEAQIQILYKKEIHPPFCGVYLFLISAKSFINFRHMQS